VGRVTGWLNFARYRIHGCGKLDIITRKGRATQTPIQPPCSSQRLLTTQSILGTHRSSRPPGEAGSIWYLGETFYCELDETAS